jgi:hypothetical protein
VLWGKRHVHPDGLPALPDPDSLLPGARIGPCSTLDDSRRAMSHVCILRGMLHQWFQAGM